MAVPPAYFYGQVQQTVQLEMVACAAAPHRVRLDVAIQAEVFCETPKPRTVKHPLRATSCAQDRRPLHHLFVRPFRSGRLTGSRLDGALEGASAGFRCERQNAVSGQKQPPST